MLAAFIIFAYTLPSLGAPVPSPSDGWPTTPFALRGMLQVSERQEGILKNAWAITKDIAKWPRYLSDLSDRTRLSESNVKAWFKNVRILICILLPVWFTEMNWRANRACVTILDESKGEGGRGTVTSTEFSS